MKNFATFLLIACSIPLSCQALSITPVNYPKEVDVYDIVWGSDPGRPLASLPDYYVLDPRAADSIEQIVDSITSLAGEEFAPFDDVAVSWATHFRFYFADQYDRRLSESTFYDGGNYDFEPLPHTEYGARVFAKDTHYASRVPDSGATASLSGMALFATLLASSRISRKRRPFGTKPSELD
ncbi:hypothetical protein [Pelagicoccus sp. SDUM812002]|uniref:hypothetical protein n=1 Tax=Pelagicoccus sp. SDUM812002 TaxID=3041266 RepID=UPI00280F96DF|nr:hypothetical protein [Pelagicoccus sp. SDUM812002]MDQ8186934.1 hypothetical protein [Pelagicoccus sp. SDUM812002]